MRFPALCRGPDGRNVRPGGNDGSPFQETKAATAICLPSDKLDVLLVQCGRVSYGTRVYLSCQ